MEPYVIKQGDYLAKLASRFGFDAMTVWNDGANEDLKARRSNPKILFPGDVLYIPDQVDKKPVTFTLVTGALNSFVSEVATITLTQRFVGATPATYASKPFTVAELDGLTGLATDENGVATFPIPVTLEAATVVFTDPGESWELLLGHMDPISTLRGIFKRLQNLHYIGNYVPFDSDTPLNNLPILRDGLLALKQAQSGGAASPQGSASDSGSGPDSAPAGDAPDRGSESGLDDNGVLDEATAKLLRDAHGC